jgi:hypothetical protein
MTIKIGQSNSVGWGVFMTFKQAIRLVERDEKFKAIVYAINTLLIQKGVYTTEEFEALFIKFVEARNKNNRREVHLKNAS